MNGFRLKSGINITNISKMKVKTILSKDPKDTQELAKILLCDWLTFNEKKNSSWLVCLSGELGSGKTYFAKSLAKELGVKGMVNSPTFLIMKKYISGNNKKYALYHFDCYRISDPKEVLDLGWEEILNGENNIIVVEWPEKIEKILPGKRLNISFKITGESSREIKFS